MTETGILTGQYVRILQPTASIGDRIVAQLIDWTAQLAYLIFVIWLLDKTGHDDPEPVFLCAILPVMLYPLLCEVLNHGQTLGKMARRMRVVMLDGTSPSLGAYLLRWLLIIVDGASFLFLGSLFIMFTRHHQRLGDLTAGTVVVKLQSYQRSRISLDDYDYLSQNYRPQYAAAAELSLEQANVIAHTLESQNEGRIELLARKVEETLSITRRESFPDLFLQAVLHDYQFYALEAV